MNWRNWITEASASGKITILLEHEDWILYQKNDSTNHKYKTLCIAHVPCEWLGVIPFYGRTQCPTDNCKYPELIVNMVNFLCPK